MNLKKIFQQFVGHEVLMVEYPHESAQSSRPAEGVQLKLPSSDDPVLAEMRQLAQDNSIKELRIHPGKASPCDMDDERANVYIEEGSDGKWRVADRFHFG